VIEAASELVAPYPVLSTVGSGRPYDREPAVLFVDDRVVTPFVQLAVLLRRAGFRTIRVTTQRSVLSDLRLRRFAFDRSLHLDPKDFADLAARLSDEHIVDVQCTEELASRAYQSLGPSVLSDVGIGWSDRLRLVDKLALAKEIEGAGLLHPRNITGYAQASEVEAALGLPVVLKPRVGSSGGGVEILETRDALVRAAGDVSDPSSVFYERFVVGESVSYCAVIGPGGVERDMTYATVTRSGSPVSPSSHINCASDPRLIEVGRQLASGLGTRGLLHLDAIRDIGGLYWIHDLNLRVWGAFLAPRRAGLGLSAAYVRWLSDRVLAGGEDLDDAWIFPYCVTAANSTGPVWRRNRQDFDRIKRRLGGRYLSYELFRFIRRAVTFGWLKGREK
jgi:hypothetical protein